MKHARNDFNKHFYVTSVEDLMTVSEILYDLRIHYTIRDWMAREIVDGEDDKPTGTAFMFCYNIWDGRLRTLFEKGLIKARIISSSCAS